MDINTDSVIQRVDCGNDGNGDEALCGLGDGDLDMFKDAVLVGRVLLPARLCDNMAVMKMKRDAFYICMYYVDVVLFTTELHAHRAFPQKKRLHLSYRNARLCVALRVGIVMQVVDSWIAHPRLSIILLYRYR